MRITRGKISNSNKNILMLRYMSKGVMDMTMDTGMVTMIIPGIIVHTIMIHHTMIHLIMILITGEEVEDVTVDAGEAEVDVGEVEEVAGVVEPRENKQQITMVMRIKNRENMTRAKATQQLQMLRHLLLQQLVRHL